MSTIIVPVTDVSSDDTRRTYKLTNISLRLNEIVALPTIGGYYSCNGGDVVEITAVITTDGDFLAGVSYVWPEGHPNAGSAIQLKLPFVRHANGRPANEEVYLNATIVDSELCISGKIPSSGGDWKVLIDRCNTALKVIGAPFKVVAEDITFLA
jgi:hypothetical protein